MQSEMAKPKHQNCNLSILEFKDVIQKKSLSQDRLFYHIKLKKDIDTLVALVTIVVLLILAGVTIMYTVGDNSIIKKAQEAKNETEDAIQKEQDEIGDLTNLLKEEYSNGTSGGEMNPPTPPDTEPIKKGELVKTDKEEYTDENGDKAPIPGGFCVVEDSKDDPTDKNTVENGLVISDIAGDDLDNSKHGNQFVWIPVPDYSKFHLIEGYSNGNLQKNLSQANNPSREAGDTTNAGSPGKPNAANSVAGTAESIAMYKSVKDNKGFFIARFEAGIAGTTTSTITNDTNKQTQDGSVKPVSQRGVGVWNYIAWGGTSAVEASDNLPGNDNANGAVKVARNMYPASDTIHKVTSTLCYGVQWDAALNFIDSNYESGNATGYVKDSTGMGNYTKSIATTGSNTAYQQKHIYDMAGNVYEWTMEAYNTVYRVYRGGCYSIEGSNFPASYRGDYRPSLSSGGLIGFRPALYL